MLVLTRKCGESVILDVDGKRIEVVMIKGGVRPRIGFSAPGDVRIVRKEIDEATRQDEDSSERT